MKLRIWIEEENDFIFIDTFEITSLDELAPLYEYNSVDVIDRALGVKDLDGNDIYSNDIVEESDGSRYVVEENDFTLLDEIASGMLDVYVVGNVYENPGLI